MSSPIRRWVRTSPLGSGSFGEVSLALDLDHSTLFAVKSAPAAASPASPEALALRNELSILRSLSCPRIVRCLGGDDAHVFLEYVDGGSVADLIKQSGGQLEEPRVRSIARGILQGLLYLHHHAAVVHCDIKARNVLLQSSTGAVKIADFGAAKRMAPSPPNSTSFRGTPLWMAPEVVQGVEQGPASDIWSLGCTVVEMMQGRPPWSTGTSSELGSLLFKIACSTEEPPLPRAASPLAKDFLRKCLHRDPRKRWTAAELLQHPFLLLHQHLDDKRAAVSSPRSILDLSCSCASDDHADSCTSTISSEPPSISCCLPPKTATQPPVSNSPHRRPAEEQAGKAPSCGDSKWMTVRGSEGYWSGGDGAAAQPCVVKKGCQVDFQCAAFLNRNRSTRTTLA